MLSRDSANYHSNSDPPSTAMGRPLKSVQASKAQERIWFLEKTVSISGAYNMTQIYRITGNLDVTSLRLAFIELVKRHDILRTTFTITKEGLIQQIHAVDPTSVDFVEVGLRGTSSADVQLENIVAHERCRAFDLEQGTPIRGRLVQIDTAQYVLMLTVHHIAADGWSVALIYKELSTIYNSSVSGIADTGEVRTQFADYEAERNNLLQQNDCLNAREKYWTEALRCPPDPLQLPTDRQRSLIPSYKGDQISLCLDTLTTGAVKEFCKKRHITMYTFWLTAWSILLMRISVQDEILVGSPFMNRPDSESQEVIGPLLNTIVIRLSLADNPRVIDLFATVKSQVLSAQRFGDLPFERVLEILQIERSHRVDHVLQTMFRWQSGHHQPFRLVGLDTVPYTVPLAPASEFDISLALRHQDRDVVGEIEYASDLFDRKTISRFRDNLLVLVRSILVDDTQRVQHHRILTDEEKHNQLTLWNDTEVSRAACSIHGLFELQVAKTPKDVALVADDEIVSYSDLNLRAEICARKLRGLGVKNGTCTAVCMELCVATVVTTLGILKAGGAFLPLDPDTPFDRLESILQDSSASIVVSTNGLVARLNSTTKNRLILNFEDLMTSPEIELDSVAEIPHDSLAYVIYTSGSTGTPKGVMAEHKAVVNRLLWMKEAYPHTPGEVCCLKTSLNFVDSVCELFDPLVNGSKLFIFNNLRERGIREFTDFILRHRVSRILVVPSLLRAIVEIGVELDCLTLCISSGEALPASLAKEYLALNQKSKLLNLYGSSEVGADVTSYCVEHSHQALHIGAIPVGRPISNTAVYIANIHMELLPTGSVGQIYIAGVGLARGYINNIELTSERFVRNPFIKGTSALLYKTGDLGRYRPDGTIEFVGRVDRQVKIRGIRVELEEIEVCLTRHTQIGAAAVLPFASPAGDSFLVAFYNSAENFDEVAIRRWLANFLPDYMMPSVFCRLEHFPLTQTGKIDRMALRNYQVDHLQSSQYEEPRSKTESVLGRIWSTLLEIKRVGRNDRFFEIGGHSLLAMRLIARIDSEFAIRLPLKDVFVCSSLSEMAERIDSLAVVVPRQLHSETVVVATSDGLTINQQKHFLMRHYLQRYNQRLEPFNLWCAIRIGGRLSQSTLEESLNRLIMRYPILRTAFYAARGLSPEERYAVATDSVNGKHHELDVFIHRVEAECHIKITILKGYESCTLGEVSTEDCKDFLWAQAQKEFDYHSPPLFRAYLAELSRGEHLLFLVLPHVISDGESLRVLSYELEKTYKLIASGRTDLRDPQSPSLADFVAVQKCYLAGPSAASSIEYWKHRWDIFGAERIFWNHFPVADSNCTSSLPDVIVDSANIEGNALLRVRRSIQSAGVTPFMFFFATFCILMARYLGKEKIAIWVNFANRAFPGFEDSMGWFVNTQLVGVNLQNTGCDTEVVQRVANAVIEATYHQSLPTAYLWGVTGEHPPRANERLIFHYIKNSIESIDSVGCDEGPITFSDSPNLLSNTKYHTRRPGIPFILVSDGETGVKLQLRYDRHRFSSTQMRSLVDHWREITCRVAAGLSNI